MLETRLIVIFIWVATMLIYLLGDVLRLFSGDAIIGKIDDKVAMPWMWLLAAIIMVIPILMIVLTAILPMPAVRMLNLVIAVLMFVFNIFGLPYKGHYDNLLIIVSLIFNVLVFYYSWNW